jgi:murein L,D-transpeptidase YcbB/YkuD
MRRRRIPMISVLVIGVSVSAPNYSASAQTNSTSANVSAISAALRGEVRGDIKHFYEERQFRPLWISAGKIIPSANTLIDYLETADLDGLRPSRYRPSRLREAVSAANAGNAQALVRVETMLSDAFANYVRDLRKPSRSSMIFADPSLKPVMPSPEMVLRAASIPQSFPDYLKSMGWMSPQYVRLRELGAKARKTGLSREATARLQLNMDRARILPSPWSRHVVVDSSSGRLWYYENGKQAGEMRVVVGTPETPTPIMAGFLQWAILNPYWNVPESLTRTNIAPKVLSGRSLQSMRIEALSDWSENAKPLPASKINWAAVAAGNADVRLRELPGPNNSMGKVKLLFPNDEGIYLHDTPSRDLLKADARHFSNGCIRLEKADELTRWLLGKAYKKPGRAPEQPVALPVPVPVYTTYLTAAATATGLQFRRDVYGLDR